MYRLADTMHVVNWHLLCLYQTRTISIAHQSQRVATANWHFLWPNATPSTRDKKQNSFNTANTTQRNATQCNTYANTYIQTHTYARTHTNTHIHSWHRTQRTGKHVKPIGSGRVEVRRRTEARWPLLHLSSWLSLSWSKSNNIGLRVE